MGNVMKNPTNVFAGSVRARVLAGVAAAALTIGMLPAQAAIAADPPGMDSAVSSGERAALVSQDRGSEDSSDSGSSDGRFAHLLRKARWWGTVSAEEQRANPPVVQSSSGAYRGFEAMPGVDGFLGIRYGASPSGDGRWLPPVPAVAASDVQDAVAFGNTCPALASGDGPLSQTEDCLFLNVWRPTGISDQAKLPVYVYIHGGGLVGGSSNQVDMAEIVQRTGVIGVSINYRMGAFGFFSTPGLTDESGESGNYGFQDQQLALRWVQENAAAFGGDPARVTLGGESAGAWSVCMHLVSPGSQGLFAQAIMQSSAALCPTQTQEQAEALGSGLADRVGCSDGPTQPECLRGIDVERLLTEFGGGTPFPVRGTSTVPVDPREAIAAGDFQRVPILIGGNRDEGRTFSAGFVGAAQEQYVDFVRASFGELADPILARYPWPADADSYTAAYLVGAILTDSGLFLSAGSCVNLSLTNDLAEHVPTYSYEFAHRTGPGILPIPGYSWGAGHAAELAYFFPSFDQGVSITAQFDLGEQRLAWEMKRYWGGFVTSGEPNVTLQAKWPRFDRTERIMSLREAGKSKLISEASFREDHQCDFWDEHPPTLAPGGPAASASPSTP
jgi:carboxylesterase type B